MHYKSIYIILVESLNSRKCDQDWGLKVAMHRILNVEFTSRLPLFCKSIVGNRAEGPKLQEFFYEWREFT